MNILQLELQCRVPVAVQFSIEHRQGHYTDLHYGLKVEACAIPKGELTTTGASQQPAPFWGPFNHIHWVLDFVQGRVQMSRGYCVCCMLEFGARWKHLQ